MNGRAILDELRRLRQNGAAGKDFWASYLGSLAQLCRSPAALLARKEKDGWVRGAEWGLDQFPDTLVEKMLRLAPDLLGRLGNNGFAMEPLGAPLGAISQPVILGLGIESRAGDDGERLIILLMDGRAPGTLSEGIVRAQLVSDIPAGGSSPLPPTLAPVDVNDAGVSAQVLELLSLIISQEHFLAAAMFLTNELSDRFSCRRVSLGWCDGRYLAVVAVSHLRQIDRSSDAAQNLEAAFEEAFDRDEDLVWPAPDGETQKTGKAHETLARSSASGHLASFIIRHQGRPVAVITCEREETPFSAKDLAALKLVASLIGGRLWELHERKGWIVLWILKVLGKKFSWLWGFDQTGRKLLATLALALASWIIWGRWNYRVEVTAALDTDRIAYVSAPFEGYIQEVRIHTGDVVSAGNTLLQMDTRELYLQESEAGADLLRYSREAEKARAGRELADMRIAQARMVQAQARLDRIRYQLKQAVVTSPSNGIVVEGERERLLGAPVSKGELLFKVAQLEDLYLTLKVHERDIGDIRVGAGGNLSLLSRPDLELPFVIETIIPMAAVDPTEGARFELKAALKDLRPEWLRPGMSGLGKIEAGPRPVYWVISHRATDWLRMHLWW